MACGCNAGGAGGGARNPNIEYEVRGPDGALDPTRYGNSAEAQARIRVLKGGSFKPVEAKK